MFSARIVVSHFSKRGIIIMNKQPTPIPREFIRIAFVKNEINARNVQRRLGMSPAKFQKLCSEGAADSADIHLMKSLFPGEFE